MALGQCPVIFSWLAELVPVFWLAELNLVSLKYSAVSSSKQVLECLWVQYAFESLFQLSGCQARLFLQLLQSGSLSKTAVPPVPYLSLGIIAGASVPLTCPALLAETCQVDACVYPSALQRLEWASLSPLSSPSVSQGCVHLFQPPGLVSAEGGQCGLVLAPCARPLRCGVYVHLFRLAACTLSPFIYFYKYLSIALQ